MSGIANIIANLQRETLEATQWATTTYDELTREAAAYDQQIADGDDPAEAWRKSLRIAALRSHDAAKKFQYVKPPYSAVVKVLDEERAASHRDGLRNPFDPATTSWLTAELLLGRVGEIVARSDATMRAGRGKEITGNEAAQLVWNLANANIGRLAPVRGEAKVDGRAKVGYGVLAWSEMPLGRPSDTWSRWAEDWEKQRGET